MKDILAAASGDPAQHPYAVKKAVPPGPLVKRGPWPQRGWTDALLIPIYGPDGRVWSLEAINTDGEKDFLKGGKKRGGSHPFGKINGAARVLIGEGLATVAAVHSVDGVPAVAAMDAGNLAHAARTVRGLAPNAEIIMLADDDIKPDGSNPGLKAAMEAAALVGGLVAVPDLGRKADFWDVWRERGPDAIREALANARRPEPATPSDPPGDTDNGGAWPEPEPLTAKFEPEPYPLDALPDTLRAAVEEVAGFVKAPVPLVVSSALAALSLAYQAHIDVERAEKLHGPVGVFLLTIADSGERKSTCDGFFTSTIRQYQEEQAETMKPAIKEYQAAIAAWEAQRDGILSAVKAAGKNGNPTDELRGGLVQLQQEKPEPPRIPRLLYADATPEALAYGLAKNWPSGGVVSSEAGVVFGSHGMGKDSVMRNLSLLNQL